LARGYFFYSNFAYNQFKQYYASVTGAKHVIRFQPVTYISQFLKGEKNYNTILFFGRLSFYKGIDMLLEAIPKVLEKYPAEKFVIAGNPDFNYKIEQKIIDQYPKNIQLITKYVSTSEIIKHLQHAKFVVCPYRDATQSGVLMTSFAAGKMVIATNVGAFSEYIEDNVNGLLAEPSANGIALKIIEALQNERYKQIEKQVKGAYSEETGKHNQECILNAYQFD
jgi:glycosyltransferase involved in cell wall biosynthesis